MNRDGRRPTTRLTALRTIAPRSATARLGWGIADQAVSSITNLAQGIVVARSLGAADFGAFSLAWVTYSVILNLAWSRHRSPDGSIQRSPRRPVAIR
jgi:hypothetical protein